MGCCAMMKEVPKTSKTNTYPDNNAFKQVKTTINPSDVNQPSTNAFNNKYSNQLRKTQIPINKNSIELLQRNTKSPTYVSNNGSYVAPPSFIQKNPILQTKNSEQYPEMINYGNLTNNYRNAAGHQAENVLKDEDFGYYAANGRNVSLRVDMNH